jgi:hypothetical protein
MHLRLLALTTLALPFLASAAEPVGQLHLPSFTGLQSKASEVVDVTLGSWPLALASKFMNSDNPEDAEVKKVLSGIKSIAVRSYQFDSDFVYSKEDVDAVRKQLSAPGWMQLAQIHKRNKAQDVEVYIALTDQARASRSSPANRASSRSSTSSAPSISKRSRSSSTTWTCGVLDDALDVDAKRHRALAALHAPRTQRREANDPWSADELLTRARWRIIRIRRAVRHINAPCIASLRMLSDRHRAEDLAREVFLQLYQRSTASTPILIAFWLRKVAQSRDIACGKVTTRQRAADRGCGRRRRDHRGRSATP